MSVNCDTTLTKSLQACATSQTQQWWTRYLKGNASFMGVKTADVRKVAHQWWQADACDSVEQQLKCLLSLTQLPHTEQKMCGVLLIAETLRPSLTYKHMERLREPLEHGYLADWNTVDWFTVKILAPMVQDYQKASDALRDWTSAKPLWVRRAACVAYSQQKANTPLHCSYIDHLLAQAHALAQDSQRFAQTGVGWTLRQLARIKKAPAQQFIDAHQALLSNECKRMIRAGLLDQYGAKRR